MTDCSILDMPVAAACFKKERSSPEYVFTSCNRAFTLLIGKNLTGLTFSQIPEKRRPLFRFIKEKLGSPANHFRYMENGIPKFDIRLQRKNSGYIVCVTDLGFCFNIINYHIKKALASVPTGVVIVGGTGNIEYTNPAALKLIGSATSLRGKNFADIIPLFDETDMHRVKIKPSKSFIIHKTGLLLRKSDNVFISVSVDVTFDQIGGLFIVLINDMSEQQRSQREIVYLSYHDKLTGLYNRAFFEQKLKEYDKEKYYPISIIMGDANGLKMTNDIFGHSQGDMILVTIANILSIACREEDIVARYGGDEFVILMPHTTSDEAASVCSKILNLCDSRQGCSDRVSISFGYASKISVSENLNDTLNIAENFMYRHKLLESRSYRSSVISSLKKMLFEKSFETEEHAMRLTGLCVKAGQIMGLSQSDLNDLELFSMLHDIGKIGVKDQVLLKPGKLTCDEWTEMRRHCEIGYRIAQSAPELSHIADYILSHHERWDGTGYPQRLAGKQIPLLSRILSVADSYDAMVNDRYYRKAIGKEAALNELKRCSGTQFDPEIVKVFLKILEPKKIKESA